MKSDKKQNGPEHIVRKKTDGIPVSRRAAGIVVFSVMAVMMMALAVICRKLNLERLDHYSIVMISVNVMSMVVCASVFLALMLDSSFLNSTDISNRRFIMIWPMLYLTLWLDTVTYVTEGLPQLNTLNEIVNTAVYASAMLTAITYWEYISNEVRPDAGFKVSGTFAIRVLGVLFIIMLIANHFLGWAGYISEDGYYRAGPYVVFLGIPYLVLLMAVFAAVFSDIPAHEKYLYAMAPAIPLIVGCLTDATRLPVAYPAALVSLLFVYAEIYEKRNLKIANQEVEIEQRRSAVLAAQIKPHFVNNCMQVILLLMEENPEKAREAMEVFAIYMRGSAELMNKAELVDFSEEMEFTENYIYLQKLRFGNRFEVIKDINERDFRIPALTVQPMVENAIKYAFQGRKRTGRIYISTEKTEGGYRITVKDDGIGFNRQLIGEDSNHVGVQNVKNRVRMMTGGDLTIDSEPGEGTRIIIEIPKEIDKRRKIK